MFEVKVKSVTVKALSPLAALYIAPPLLAVFEVKVESVIAVFPKLYIAAALRILFPFATKLLLLIVVVELLSRNNTPPALLLIVLFSNKESSITTVPWLRITPPL